MDKEEDARLEQRIAEKAHHLWLEEGKPVGEKERLRQAARQLIAIEDAPATGRIPVQESLRPASEPLVTAEAQGDVPGLRDQGERQEYPSPVTRAEIAREG